MDRQPDPYLVRRPDGRWEDTRWQFGRGDKVRITSGEYTGYIGTVESIVAQMKVGDQWITETGYHIALDNEGLATIKWDEVEAV